MTGGVSVRDVDVSGNSVYYSKRRKTEEGAPKQYRTVYMLVNESGVRRL